MDQRFSFSNEQKKVLAESYERGMKSASKRCIALIEECASSAGCSIEQVKHWINAEQKRRKRSNASSEVVMEQQSSDMVTVRISKGRKRSAFQMYCRDNAGTVIGDGGSVMMQLSEKWRCLSDSDKQEWIVKANSSTYVTTPVQKSKAIRDLTTAIQNNLKVLSSLGVEGYSVFLNSATSDCQVLCSSEVIEGFVELEEKRGVSVDNHLFKYMCGASYFEQGKKKLPSYDKMLSIVRHHLKRSYCEVTGKGRIPYSDISHLGCVVTGLAT